MDSSILELKEALALLTDYNQNWSFGSNGADAGGLARSYQIARRISEQFSGVNSALEEGWSTTAELFFKLFNLVTEKFGQMYDDINKFTDATYQAELAARDAVDDANNAADEIISELGLDSKGVNTTTPHSPSPGPSGSGTLSTPSKPLH